LGQDARKAEIAKLYVVADVEKDIAWLEVSMEDLSFFSVVAFLQSKYNLKEYFPNDILRNVVLIILALLDELGHVSILAMLHYDVYPLGLLFNDPTEVFKESLITYLS
jgi:hypothetical protein